VVLAGADAVLGGARLQGPADRLADLRPGFDPCEDNWFAMRAGDQMIYRLT
jgi:hypothetical protein